MQYTIPAGVGEICIAMWMGQTVGGGVFYVSAMRRGEGARRSVNILLLNTVCLPPTLNSLYHSGGQEEEQISIMLLSYLVNQSSIDATLFLNDSNTNTCFLGCFR